MEAPLCTLYVCEKKCRQMSSKYQRHYFSGLHFNGDQKIVDDDVIMAMVMKMTIQITLMVEIVMRKMMMMMITMLLIMMVMMIMMLIMTG